MTQTLEKKLDWFTRIRTEDPEKYRAQLEKMKAVNRRNYADPDYRAEFLAKKRETYKLKAADPEWRARRAAYEGVRRQLRKAK